MFSRGQGSFEYLLVVAGILAVAVVAVVASNHVFLSSKPTESVSRDMMDCGAAGIQLVDYHKPYDGTKDTAPGGIKPCGTCAILSLGSGTSNPPSSSSCKRFSSCKLQGKYNLSVCFADGKWSAYLQSSGGWLNYGSPYQGGGGGGGSTIYPSDWIPGKPDKVPTCACPIDPSKGNAATISSSKSTRFYFDCTSGTKYTLHVYLPYFYTSTINVYKDNAEVATCSGKEDVSCDFTCKGPGWYTFKSVYTQICGGTCHDSGKGHPPYLD